ncbi:MAG: NAD(P)-dependent oxidoreductase [Candidatus Anstonellaceae archaeon]
MKLAIFGASGRLGRNFCNFCLKKDLDFIAVVRSQSSKEVLDNRIKTAIASKLEDYKKVLDGIDCVVNLSGSTNFNLTYEELYRANVLATEEILNAASKKDIKKFIHISSIAVYPILSGRVINEEVEPSPSSSYGKTKLEGEKRVLSFAKDFEIIVLQPGMIYGPDFKEGFYPVLKKIKEGKMPLIGEGNNHIPLIFYKDVIDAIFLSIYKKAQTPKKYLIVQEPQLTQKELFFLAAKILNANTNFFSVPTLVAKLVIKLNLLEGINEEMLNQLVQDRLFDCKKAREDLGWSAKTPFEEGIEIVTKSFFPSSSL